MHMYNHFSAASCNENGKALSLMCFLVIVVGHIDEQTWNSFKCWYMSSPANPWNLSKIWINPDFSSNSL